MLKPITPKSEEMYGPSCVSGSPKKMEPKKYYPSINLRHEFFPETKKWEVGKVYTVTLKMKMTGLSISKYQNDAQFDIVGADMDSKGEDEKEEKGEKE